MRLLTSFLILLTMLGCNASQAEKSLPESYTWRNLSIGGGGYITGVKIHPNNADLIYLRTDVGGCYRYDHDAKQLKQLITDVPFEQCNLYGINGIALDPNNQNLVYIAAGKYPDKEHADVFRSDDQGETWQAMGLNKTWGANFHPFRTGNLLEVNPHTSEVWAGTLGEGLWKYSNNEWVKIESVPDGEFGRIAGGNLATGTLAICFDPQDANYVYVAVRGYGVYRSTDGGEVFAKVGDIPTGFFDLSLSKSGNELFAAANRDGVFRLKDCKKNSKWDDVSFIKGDHRVRTVTCSPHDNNTIISADARYDCLNKIVISTDGGDTWKRLSGKARNIVNWHPATYAGSSISQFAFDPVDSKKVYFTDWFSFYRTEDIFAPVVEWDNEMAYGHEEMVPVTLLSNKMPNNQGVFLYVGGADLSAIQMTDPDKYSTLPNIRSLVQTDLMQEVSGMDYYEQDPNRLAFMGGRGWAMQQGCLALSTDGSKTLKLVDGYLPEWGGGKVAFSGNNPDNLVVATQEGIRYTTDGGKTFHKSEGTNGAYVRTGIFQYVNPLCGDRVNGNFYLYNYRTGDFLVSTDGGKSFEKRATLPAGNEEKKLTIIAPFDQSGHLFAALGDNGLYTSNNSGEEWTKSETFASAMLIAAGKGITDDSYPAIYLFGKKEMSDPYRFFRSTDGGATWLLVNDEARAGNETQAMCADRNVFGRFYVATNGTGVFVAELAE